MEKIVKGYENEELFEEILEHYELDTWSGWLVNRTKYSYEETCRLFDKKTGQRVGWYAFEEYFDDAGEKITQEYITIE